MARPDRLERLAAAVSDGTPVDWESEALAVSTPEERERIVQLRLLDNVAQFHRAGVDPGPRADETRTIDLSAGTAWGPLELREILGRGAFGRVYRAWDPNLQRDVALKLVETTRFRGVDPATYLREGRLLARVRHPNVAQVYGADVRAGSAGIWMELIQGSTLEALLTEQGPFGAIETAGLGIEVCRGLAAVHAAGLIHRDVKTSNIMRERGGRIVLMDLGAGLDVAAEGARADGMTGTPYYMAPEILRATPATERSDLYSVGVVLFRLFSAAFPVTGQTLGELIEAHASGRRRSLRDLRPDLPPELIRIVDRALAADPAERHATAGELQAALEAYVGSGRVARQDTAPSEGHVEPRRRRRRIVATFAALALVAAIGTTATIFVGRGRSSSGPFRVEATLYRNAGVDRERLRDGDSIGTGDRLSMDIEASTDLHVYVLNQDDSGETYLLFPLAGLEPGNPLPARTQHRLPGTLDGRAQAWVVTSDGGGERFLIVASREPLKEIEQDLASLRRPTAESGLRYARLSEASRRRLRGVGGLTDDYGPTEGPTDVFDVVAGLADGDERAEGVWIRRIRLQGR